MLNKVHEEMPSMDFNDTEKLLVYARHFHKMCIVHTIEREDSVADKIMKKILKMDYSKSIS